MAELRRIPDERGTKLELREGDTLLSSLLVVEVPMRIGDIVVRCGGIGGVYTERVHRMQGWGRQLLQQTVDFMQEAGYHVSFLFGIPQFYYRFGYAPAMVTSEMSVATRDAEAAPRRYAVREIEPGDTPAVAEIYERLRAGRTVSVVRKPATWRGFRINSRWSDRVGAFVVLDGEQIIAYAAYDQDLERCAIAEVGSLRADAYSTLLGETGRRALAQRTERITFHIPYDDPFVTYCQRYGCEVKLTYPRWGTGMGRIVRQQELFALLQPLLARRMQAAGLGDWAGTVVLETELGQTRLTYGQGGPELRARLPQPLLAQLLFGYRSVEDALFETEAQADAALVPVLAALFPTGYPYMWATDRF